MANITYLMKDLEYYSETHQTYLRYATKTGPVGNWSEKAFTNAVVGGLSARIKTTDPFRVLGIGSGAGGIDCIMMEKLLPNFPRIENTIVEPSKAQLSLFKKRVKECDSSLKGVSFDWRQETVDKCVEHLADGTGGIAQKFHLIHALHSAYYTADMERTLGALYDSLVEGGVLFIAMVSNDSVFIKLDEKQIDEKANRPRHLTDESVTSALDSLNLPYAVERGKWQVPCSLCFDENSQDGRHLLDFLTHSKDFRKTASQELLEVVLQCLRSPDISEEVDGEVMVFRHWVHIMVTK